MIYSLPLDIQPLKPGHTLVIPKTEINYIFDIDDALLGQMMVFAQKWPTAFRPLYRVSALALVLSGWSTPCSYPPIPIESVSDINFSKAKMQLDKDEMVRLASQISAAVSL